MFVKGAASRIEDLPYSWFHYRPILTTILLKAKIINLVEILINSLPIQGKALPFAMESSQGIREEGNVALLQTHP